MIVERRIGLVTGANRGIGREIAHQLAARDIHVIVTARDADQAHQVAANIVELGYAASPARLDVAAPGAAGDVQQIIAKHGRIDVLVNNAGISDVDQRPSTADLALGAHVWQTNVVGAWRCAKAVIPGMRETGYGRIVNMSSTLGSLHHMDRPTEPAYRISKAALNALTRVLAAELAGTGILVNSASPGWVRTDLGGPNAPRTVQQGADTAVWLATLPSDGPTGGFFYEREPMEW
ncbi:MAG: SDR family NAD(P)-dependent oxidoreductase [Actinobacteria bacterium]|nr:SDR family NAD(P)-dependent oxidoreductase [Actinomycetota bacterium]